MSGTTAPVVNPSSNDSVDLKNLSLACSVVLTLINDDLEGAKEVVKQIRELEPQMRDYNMSAITDVLVTNTYDHVTDTHLYYLEEFSDYPDIQQLRRIAMCRKMFDKDTDTRKAFIAEYATDEKIFTGHQTDYFFCSMLIRLALSAKDWDSIKTIRGFLDTHYDTTLAEEQAQKATLQEAASTT